MFIFAKVLQALGCADVGFALFVGISQNSLAREFELTGIGILVFAVGYAVEALASRRS
jgi:high-affinity Fe2+/Pb2+ permease